MNFVSTSLSRSLFRRVIATAALGACGILCAAHLPAPDAAATPSTPAPYPSIQKDLTNGHANDAISLLQKQLSTNSADAAAHQLLCRVYLQEERWPDAEKECEQAVQLAPNNSNDHLWLGRAYGGAAAHASLGSAYMLARKVRAEFETAVRLDPQNVTASADLGEYYVDVPRLIGGGEARAEKIARQLAPLDASRSHALQAKIDAKKSDFSGAEQEWKQAIRTSQQPARRWMDLASFYARQKNFSAMQKAIANGVATDPSKGAALVHGASLLIHTHQNLQQATQMLQEYLASPHQSEETPAFRVHVQLGKLLASQGDQAAAQKQYIAAQALASNYAPAQSGSHG